MAGQYRKLRVRWWLGLQGITNNSVTNTELVPETSSLAIANAERQSQCPMNDIFWYQIVGGFRDAQVHQRRPILAWTSTCKGKRKNFCGQTKRDWRNKRTQRETGAATVDRLAGKHETITH